MPAISAVSIAVLSSFLLWPLTVLIKQTRQQVCAVKQSIYLDVYGLNQVETLGVTKFDRTNRVISVTLLWFNLVVQTVFCASYKISIILTFTYNYFCQGLYTLTHLLLLFSRYRWLDRHIRLFTTSNTVKYSPIILKRTYLKPSQTHLTKSYAKMFCIV